MRAAVRLNVVGIPPGARDQPRVLAPSDRTADGGAHGHGANYPVATILARCDRAREAMGSAALLLELPGSARRDVNRYRSGNPSSHGRIRRAPAGGSAPLDATRA